MADFPLFLHQNGQWAKKVRGRTHYFGTDQDEALKKWLRERDDLLAGREPRSDPEALTVRDLVNRFLNSKRLLVDSGELSPRSWSHYYGTLAVRLIGALGKTRPVESLTAEDFERLRAKLARGRGTHALAGEVQRIRTLFKYAWDRGLIDRPIRFGDAFRKPSAKQLRTAKQTAEPWTIDAADLRQLLDAADGPMRAMILLGINCGFGNSDVANLPKAAIAAGWVIFPRPKTAIPRRCKLWKETQEAIEEAIRDRPRPKDTADAGLVFLTHCGNRWVRTIDKGPGRPAVPCDAVRLEFDKLLVRLGLKKRGRSFYSLRHTFRTVADGAKDQPAADLIMGHADPSMAGNYRETIDDGRLEAVTGLVRSWLWPKPKIFQPERRAR